MNSSMSISPPVLLVKEVYKMMFLSNAEILVNADY
jgi:hypothetical protein